MTAAKFIPALALGMLPLFAQTNAVNVDQVVTLRATLSSLNVNPPVFSTPSGTNPNTTSTGTATLTIRFIGGNSTNTNPVTGTPLPVTGTTTNVSRATVTLSMTPTQPPGVDKASLVNLPEPSIEKPRTCNQLS